MDNPQTALDPHLAWYAEWRACLDYCNHREYSGELHDQPEWARVTELEELIGNTPARTLPGALAQLRVANHWLGGSAYCGEDVDAAIENAIATLGRLAGEEPAPALPAVVATLPAADAALVELGRRIVAAGERSDRRCRRLDAVGRSIDISHDPVVRTAVDEAHACIEAAGRLPARTPAGLLVKARIVRDEVTMGSTMCADGVAESLVADLERLAGEARHV